MMLALFQKKSPLFLKQPLMAKMVGWRRLEIINKGKDAPVAVCESSQLL